MTCILRASSVPTSCRVVEHDGDMFGDVCCLENSTLVINLLPHSRVAGLSEERESA